MGEHSTRNSSNKNGRIAAARDLTILLPLGGEWFGAMPLCASLLRWGGVTSQSLKRRQSFGRIIQIPVSGD